MPHAAGRHRPIGWERLEAQRREQADRLRSGQAHRRLYGTAAYQRFRLAFLAEHPVCQDCGRAGASEVHHARKLREHLGDLVDGRTCLALCKPCHDVRTGRGE